eukprot:GHVU01228675.1.p1 GENE.GHVU01228675.1~~GHVU01228675.1.p1  ORF type:complete len:221 (-),score=37.27 GHVU01228675.1:232-894(-)
MPKSKRQQKVSLTKVVKKNGKAAKVTYVEELQGAVAKFKYVYLVSLENQRNVFLKKIRERIKPGRLFYGKNKVVQATLGTRPDKELKPNLHEIVKDLKGERALVFCDLPVSELKEKVQCKEHVEFARVGFVPQKSIVLEPGFDTFSFVPSCQEPHLRKICPPVRLVNTKIELLCPFHACEEGVALSAEQAQLLKHLGHKLAPFSVKIEAVWHDGKYTIPK